MSDSEDFLLHFNVEELISETETERKRKSEKKSKKRKKKMKFSKLIPSHFLGFQIYDSIIRQRITELQSKIVDKNPLLKKALIDVRTLHVTLAVTHLQNEEQEGELKEKLQNWSKENFKDHFREPMLLTFRGIGMFRKEVVFIKLVECENYSRLCNFAVALNEMLINAGFYADNKKYTPHLTLLKLSRNYKVLKKQKSLDMDILLDCQHVFGHQEVKDIQLLSMRDKKDDEGYYKCLWQMPTADFSQGDSGLNPTSR